MTASNGVVFVAVCPKSMSGYGEERWDTVSPGVELLRKEVIPVRDDSLVMRVSLIVNVSPGPTSPSPLPVVSVTAVALCSTSSARAAAGSTASAAATVAAPTSARAAELQTRITPAHRPRGWGVKSEAVQT